MRRLFFILLVCLSAFLWADDYVDDVYYQPQDGAVVSAVKHSKRIREIVFVEDSTVSRVDTVSIILK